MTMHCFKGKTSLVYFNLINNLSRYGFTINQTIPIQAQKQILIGASEFQSILTNFTSFEEAESLMKQYWPNYIQGQSDQKKSISGLIHIPTMVHSFHLIKSLVNNAEVVIVEPIAKIINSITSNLKVYFNLYPQAYAIYS